MRLIRQSVADSTVVLSVLVGRKVEPEQLETATPARGVAAAAAAGQAPRAHGNTTTASVARSPLTDLSSPARRVQEILQDRLTRVSLPRYHGLKPRSPVDPGLFLANPWGVVQWQDIRFWS